MKWTSIALLVLLAGCDMGDQVQEQARPIDELPTIEQAQKALDAMPSTAELPPPLTALMALLRYDMIKQYHWAPSANELAATYEGQLSFIVPDTSCWVLHSGKDAIVLQVRGVSDLGIVGPWSDPSDTLWTR